MNVAMYNWKASGNGKGVKSGEYRFNRIAFIQCDNNDDDNQSVEQEYKIKYVDDDRGKFIEGDLSVGYFWGLTDMVQLVTTVLQNCKAVGMTMEDNREASTQKCILKKRKRGTSDLDNALISMKHKPNVKENDPPNCQSITDRAISIIKRHYSSRYLIPNNYFYHCFMPN